ncbi:MAG: hypothetical protein HY904_07645 [Deltaproteobacteria bacterium]|nr:hypothetical protein [Deltaproteobacteria bacterium]
MKQTSTGRWWLVGCVAVSLGTPAALAAPRTTQITKTAAKATPAPAADAPVSPTPTTPEVPVVTPPEVVPPGDARPGEGGVFAPFVPLVEGLTDNLQLGRPEKFPVGMRAVLDTSVGSGGFVLNQYARQPSVSNTLRLQPSLAIWKSLKASMVLQVTKEWIVSPTQSTTVPNQILLQDLWMGVGMPQIYRDEMTGLSFGAGLWTYAPTSIQSRSETLLVAARPWVTLAWSKWGFEAGYTLGVRKNFHQYVNPTVDARSGAVECTDLSGRCFVAEVDAGVAPRDEEGFLKNVGGGRVLDLRRRNVSYQVSHQLTAGYTLFDKLSFSGMLMLASAFRYANPQNEFSSPNAQNPQGHTDVLWSNLDVSYALFDHVAFSTGWGLVQPFYMMNRGSGIPGWNTNGQNAPVSGGVLFPAFPFWDFFTPGNNLQSFYFDVIISL